MGTLTRETALRLASMVAIPTIHKKNGLGASDAPIDFEQQARIVEHVITNGVQAIVAAGTTGEAATMDHREQALFIREVVAMVNGRVPVIAGAGSNCTRESLELIDAVMHEGADGVLVVSPYYNKPEPRGQEAHYDALCNLGAPLMLYSVKGRTGRSLDTTVAGHLWQKHPNIIGFKQADSDLLPQTIWQGNGITVWLGNDDDIPGWLFKRNEATIAGVVSVVGNVQPHQVNQLVTRWRSGKDTLNDQERAALALTQHQVAAMSRACFRLTNPLGVKTLLAHRGIIKEACFRLPLCPLTEAEKREIIMLSEEGMG